MTFDVTKGMSFKLKRNNILRIKVEFLTDIETC